ncbi:MAG: CDP-alcohol phosphatidyltransferase family protein [Gemmatimonadetes bacterium]|nr:CDP-alcohol phosphatidyltransferase family protein [Gemmatimonadota bacterium]MBI3566937.1 CDP-alcohol phosphatidyltransferase family protein [Gemmatimonadota bacterium]
MQTVWQAIKAGYLRLIEPIADALVRRRVSPNVITTIGTCCTLAAAAIYASGHISIAGWVLGLTAVFDVLDGTVARRTGRETAFGAFYDSTLDRVADGALLGGLALFWASDGPRHSVVMVGVCLVAIIGTFLTSYTRARADGLGIDAKVGLMQRPERIVLLSAPQAFFGLALDGWVLIAIVWLLAATAWITAVQRILFVRRVTSAPQAPPHTPLPNADGGGAPQPLPASSPR